MIVKHTNPCGVATATGGGTDLLEAYRLAVRADPVSAFGGIVAFNRPVDAELARELREFRCGCCDCILLLACVSALLLERGTQYEAACVQTGGCCKG